MFSRVILFANALVYGLSIYGSINSFANFGFTVVKSNNSSNSFLLFIRYRSF